MTNNNDKLAIHKCNFCGLNCEPDFCCCKDCNLCGEKMQLYEAQRFLAEYPLWIAAMSMGLDTMSDKDFAEHTDAFIRTIIRSAKTVTKAEQQLTTKDIEDAWHHGCESGKSVQAEKIKQDIAAMCGIPDADNACRAILKYLQNLI